MKIDTHQHFWEYRPADYPWIGPGMEALARDRLPADLKPLIDRMGIGGTVAVQARQCVAETERLLRLAEENAFIVGVVGWVDLRSPDVDRQLERFASHPKLVGVRHVVQDEPDERFVLGEAFLRGVGKLAKYGLAYDLLVFPHQLPASLELVSRLPSQQFVLDHMAKPDIKGGKLAPWNAYVRELAARENVACKMSGLVTEADWTRWTPRDLTPYLDVVLEAFGPSRLMIGSDWPVCTLAGTYEVVLGAVVDYVARLSAAERHALWHATPARIYGLTV